MPPPDCCTASRAAAAVISFVGVYESKSIGLHTCGDDYYAKNNVTEPDGSPKLNPDGNPLCDGFLDRLEYAGACVMYMADICTHAHTQCTA